MAAGPEMRKMAALGGLFGDLSPHKTQKARRPKTAGFRPLFQW
jgi:hypothetical protein